MPHLSDTEHKAPVRPGARNAARTVEDGFREFVEQLEPKYAKSDAAVAKLNVIERCLGTQFEMSYLAPYGSTGHGTNIADCSCMDYFAVMPKARLLENSGASLERVAAALVEVAPGTFVTEGRPVVAVPFGEERHECHHVVPAFSQGSREEHDIFAIPAPSNRWVNVCPGAHSVWINDLDDLLDKNFKPFVRVVKAWNHYNGEPLWSYYLELSVADFLKRDATIIYALDLCKFFKYMLARELRPFSEAEGSAEPVYGTAVANKEATRAALASAAEMADKARECEQRGNTADAFYWWRKLFNWRFTAY